METKHSGTFWWLKNTKDNTTTNPIEEETPSIKNLTVPKLDLEISSSLAEFLEKEQNILNSNRDETDVGSIIEEINRVAAQSPLGPYQPSPHERSIDDIMKEAERVYMESSKSFEQLSQRSKTSQNITDLNSSSSKHSTPTPKSISPLPNDDDSESSETYSEDFSDVSKVQSVSSPEAPQKSLGIEVKDKSPEIQIPPIEELVEEDIKEQTIEESPPKKISMEKKEPDPITETATVNKYEETIAINEELIKTLQDDNKLLREDIKAVKADLQQTNILLQQARTKSLSSPEVNLELAKTLEKLKDSKEINTALQLQLNAINKTHSLLKSSYDELSNSNANLERRVSDLDAALGRYKTELLHVQQQKDKLLESEISVNKLLEIETIQVKRLKLQNEKDARCIQDLNRQVKEMERIIARKHPDSVSALIVAAKNDAGDTNLTARKILEDRIRTLEEEALNRDTHSSKIFIEIQDKFNQMKLKYESHIDDLELHVSDLKDQLKRKIDTYDVYTQTASSPKTLVPQKDSATVSTQTHPEVALKNLKKISEAKEDAHLLATIRGLQADLTNKEKVVVKMQKELDDLRKTNRKLQKEREGSLRNLSEKKEFRSYPEKLATQAKSPVEDEDLKVLRGERDKMKQQLCRIEEDYQALKAKRLHDLNVLQEAHEREMGAHISSVAPLREQIELQQLSISTLQSQLAKIKEELIIVTVERDHLSSQQNQNADNKSIHSQYDTNTEALQKKIVYLEKRYEEREFRLRAIVHGLAQKNVTNRSCEQCAERQQQLVGYKNELDQILATLRSLK